MGAALQFAADQDYLLIAVNIPAMHFAQSFDES